MALFISDLVDTLDLSAIYSDYDDAVGGQPPYHPALMVKLLCYGYCTGIHSSRQIERATWENVPFRVLATDQHPDHDSIASFRKRHLPALSQLFKQVLTIAMKAGLADLEHVSIDGTKVSANASRMKTYSAVSLVEREKHLQKIVDETLAEALRVDQEEDKKYGDRSSLELEGALSRHQTRLQRIIELKKAMEEEQAQIDEAKKAEQLKKEKAENDDSCGGNKRKQGRPPRPKSSTEDDDEQPPSLRRNLTDYDSRIMRLPGSNWGQSYNAQAVVDSKHQIIVASHVTNAGNDSGQLVPMLTLTKKLAGRAPKYVTADSGYSNKEHLRSKLLRESDLIIPPPRKRLDGIPRRGVHLFPPTELMKQKLQKPEYKALYRMRKMIVEPVFGQIKEARGFRRFAFRGLSKVQKEWDLVCLTHNMLKIYRSGWCPS